MCKIKNIDCVLVDGSDAENESLRTTLFNIARIALTFRLIGIERCNGRQEYPAYFALHPDKTIVFLGHEKEVQKLIDEDDVDPELLRQCPDVLTFTRCFKWPA